MDWSLCENSEYPDEKLEICTKIDNWVNDNIEMVNQFYVEILINHKSEFE